MIFLALVIAIVFVISSKYIETERFNTGILRRETISSIFSFPKKISKYFISEKEVIQYSTIPKEVLLVYNDLEKRLNDKSVRVEEKTDAWKLEKSRETAIKYNITTDKVMELYVKVKNAK